MRRLLLSALVCLVIAGGCGYEERQSAENRIIKSSGGEQGAREVGAAAVMYAIKIKKDHQQALEARLDKMDKKIMEMEVRLGTLNQPEAQRFREIIQRAHEEAKSAHSTYGRFKKASVKSWDGFKVEIEGNLKIVEELYRQASSSGGPNLPGAPKT